MLNLCGGNTRLGPLMFMLLIYLVAQPVLYSTVEQSESAPGENCPQLDSRRRFIATLGMVVTHYCT